MATPTRPETSETGRHHPAGALSDLELEQVTAARNRRIIDWVFHDFEPHLGQRVLDAGGGIGTYTAKILESGRQGMAVEYEPSFVELIRARFGGQPGFEAMVVDLTGETAMPALAGRFHPVLSVNVLEHIADERPVLPNLFAALLAGGHLCLLVPANPWLLNELDRSLGHFRRYSKAGLREKVTAAGFEVVALYHINAFAALGWLVSGTLLRRRHVSPGLSGVYDALVPFFRLFERYLLRRSFGQSLICIARKPHTTPSRQ